MDRDVPIARGSSGAGRCARVPSAGVVHVDLDGHVLADDELILDDGLREASVGTGVGQAPRAFPGAPSDEPRAPRSDARDASDPSESDLEGRHVPCARRDGPWWPRAHPPARRRRPRGRRRRARRWRSGARETRTTTWSPGRSDAEKLTLARTSWQRRRGRSSSREEDSKRWGASGRETFARASVTRGGCRDPSTDPAIRFCLARAGTRNRFPPARLPVPSDFLKGRIGQIVGETRTRRKT